LEPLSGYLLLAARLAAEPALAGAYNFGPALSSNRTVVELVQEGLKHWPGKWEDCSDPNAPHEAGKLNLATDKAFHTLGWSPRWNFETTVARTIAWYKAAHEGQDVRSLVDADLEAYVDC
jgi:CDP-glucose 4,6-dehydratase